MNNGLHRGPDRGWQVRSPLAIAVHEWGRPEAPPLLLFHGGGDSARSFDVFAPLLAAGGWRVVAFDQRGHGDSDHGDLYGYTADHRDAAAVLDAVGGGFPVPLVGHSKGGVMAIEVAAARPRQVSAVVSIDGFVRRRAWEPEPPVAAAQWLEGRRTQPTARPAAPETLADRRGRANPRVDRALIEHLVGVTSRPLGDGRSRWKLDPAAFPPPPHGWRDPFSLDLLGRLSVPFLALQAGVAEPIAGQPDTATLAAALPTHGRLTVLDGVGHFAHLEAPELVTGHVLGFLADQRHAHALTNPK